MNGIRVGSVESRFPHLTMWVGIVVAFAIHAGERLFAGMVFGLMQNGLYRAYAEGEVVAAFSTGSTAFTISGSLAKHFRVGDVVTKLDDTEIGTIASYDPATGVGTLAANALENHAVGQRVKVREADLGVQDYKARVLKTTQDELEEDLDVSAMVEGVIVTHPDLHTDHLVSVLGYRPTADELRIK